MTSDTGRLVQEASKGDRVALDALLAQFLPDLEQFLRLRVGQRLLAKESSSDLLQSVCREVLQDLDSIEYRGVTEFKQWLFLTSLRKIKDRAKFWRRDRRDVGRETDETSVAPLDDRTPSSEAILREDTERLQHAFEQLPDDHRAVITYSRYLGMSHAQIAAEMDRSEGAVRVLLHRALARLGVLMDEDV